MIVLSLGLHSDRKKFIQAVKIQNPIKIGIPGKMISSMYINFHRNWYRAQICRVCQIIIYHKIELIFSSFCIQIRDISGSFYREIMELPLKNEIDIMVVINCAVL